RNLRHGDMRVWEWRGSSELERQQPRGSTLRFGGRHDTDAPEVTRVRPQSDGNQHVLLALDGEAHRHRIDRRARLDRPELFALVGAESLERARALSLEHEIAGGGQHTTVGRKVLTGRPARRLMN